MVSRMSVFSTGSNVLLIFLGFGMLIFIHELGHFLAAKWVGIRAEGFCVGFAVNWLGTKISWR